MGLVRLARRGLLGGGQLVRRGLRVATGWPPLARLRAAIGRLPPALALPLFLVPELCSRGGWAMSAWLLWQGHAGRAMAVYAATKLLAGGSALWIYAACEPALLRIPWFAATHGAATRWRRAALARFGKWRLRARSAAPAPLPATASTPAGRGPTE